jgi:sulfite reductase (ferredoxin)
MISDLSRTLLPEPGGAASKCMWGGLGAMPYQAKLFDNFVPETEILPLAQAISRVFARLGEKRNRGRARIKFLIDKLGIDRFRELVLAERGTLAQDAA